MSEEIRSPALKIFKYLLKNGKTEFSKILEYYGIREAHTYWRKDKKKLIESDVIIESDKEIIDINYDGDNELLKDDALRFGLLNSGAIEKVFTPNCKMKKMTFSEAYDIFVGLQKAMDGNQIKRIMGNNKYMKIINKRFGGFRR